MRAAWTSAVVATWTFRAILGAAAGYRLVHLTVLRLQLFRSERAKGVEGFEALGHGQGLFLLGSLFVQRVEKTMLQFKLNSFNCERQQLRTLHLDGSTRH
jgi:hypothetical protein